MSEEEQQALGTHIIRPGEHEAPWVLGGEVQVGQPPLALPFLGQQRPHAAEHADVPLEETNVWDSDIKHEDIPLENPQKNQDSDTEHTDVPMEKTKIWDSDIKHQDSLLENPPKNQDSDIEHTDVPMEDPKKSRFSHWASSWGSPPSGTVGLPSHRTCGYFLGKPHKEQNSALRESPKVSPLSGTRGLPSCRTWRYSSGKLKKIRIQLLGPVLGISLVRNMGKVSPHAEHVNVLEKHPQNWDSALGESPEVSPHT